MLFEVFASLKVGDSCTFQIPAQDLFEKSFRSQVPDSIKVMSNIQFTVGLESSMPQADYVRLSEEKQLNIDSELIDSCTSPKTELRLKQPQVVYAMLLPARGEGENAIPGKTVFVHYSGTLLDGTKFDSSYDRGSPFSFTLGQGRVIKGWDEGIALLNKGAKATLYIPSVLGYGSQGAGPTIGPNSVLKFEVELIDFQ